MTIIIVLSLLLIFAFYMLTRNNKVLKFRLQLNEKCYVWSNAHINEPDAWEWCLDKIASYYKMMFLFFKPLKEKNWLTKEMIEKFNN